MNTQPNSANDAIVDALRDALLMRGIKMTKVSRALGVPYRTLQNHLTKTSPMSLDVYIGLCRALRISLDDPVSRAIAMRSPQQDFMRVAIADVVMAVKVLGTIAAKADANIPHNQVEPLQNAALVLHSVVVKTTRGSAA